MQQTTASTSKSGTRAPVKRAGAEAYIFISLTCFGLTVAVTRVYLEMTGYPQIGNSVLHFAHALWGGLLLFLATLVTLILANRWAFTLSAVLSGVGVGLFIDEVGKFITQKNDYFFPPAAPIIYSTFLLMVLLFLLVRGARRPSPRRSMYSVLSDFGEVLDSNLDANERAHLLVELNNGSTSPDPHIAQLAAQLAAYLQNETIPLVPYRPSYWVRGQRWLRTWGEKLGRRRHRLLVLWLLLLGSVAALLVAVLLVLGGLAVMAPNLDIPTLKITIDETTTQHPAWFVVRLVLQLLVSVIYFVALVRFWRGHERGAVAMALFAALLAFTMVNLVNFYVSQFGALAAFFANLTTLLVLLAYRAWYLTSPDTATEKQS